MIILSGFLPPMIIHIAAARLIPYSLLTAVMFHNFWRRKTPRGPMAWPV